jgi:hypothetical protein
MNTRNRMLLFVASLAVAGLACSVVDRVIRGPAITAPEAKATATRSAAATLEATTAPTAEGSRRLELPPTPTAFTVSEDDVRAVLDLGHPDYFDPMDNPEGWFDYDTPGRAAYWIADGKMFGVDYEPDEIYTWWTYSDRASGNLYTEVSATNGDCVDRDSVGLAIRVDRDKAAGGYSLEVSCDGAWRFRMHQIGGDQVEFIDWTDSDAIHTGPAATNRLGIFAYQARFHLFINGVDVGEYWDTHYRYSYGSFALYTRSSRTYDLTSTFDDFAYWNIDFIP